MNSNIITVVADAGSSPTLKNRRVKLELSTGGALAPDAVRGFQACSVITLVLVLYLYSIYKRTNRFF